MNVPNQAPIYNFENHHPVFEFVNYTKSQLSDICVKKKKRLKDNIYLKRLFSVYGLGVKPSQVRSGHVTRSSVLGFAKYKTNLICLIF